MLRLHRTLHSSTSVSLGHLTTGPSLPSMPCKERSPYAGNAFDCFPAPGSARHVTVGSSNRPASGSRTVALQLKGSLSSPSGVLSDLPGVPARQACDLSSNQNPKSTGGRDASPT